jgi:transcriptional regulator GlxA family with amidase domain
MRTRPYRLAIVTFDEMDLLDVAGPLEVFSTAGRKWNFRAIKANLICNRAGSVQTRAQLQIGPAGSFESCSEPELLLIPGGYGARRAATDPDLLAYLARVQEGLILTMSVGSGALVAARAGLLVGAEVACVAALAEELEAIDATITTRPNARTTSSARSITAAQNGAALDLGLEVVARLLGKSQAAATARELGYPWGTETLTLEILP